MKIIQSFAQFEEGSPYLQHRNKRDYIYLTFYTALLSNVSITKTYSNPTMFCNAKAYNSILKYIPYDTFQIIENENDIWMWCKYKVDIMRTIGDDFIHLDPDVSLFEPVLDPFINRECDILVQDIVPFKYNSLKPFVFNNQDFFANTNILTKPFDGGAMSCGSVGLTKEVQEYYFAGIDVLYEAMLKIGLKNINYPSLILEEQLLYLLAVENEFDIHQIVPHGWMREDVLNVGEMKGYLHLWMQLKYKKFIINMVRQKIFQEFPEYFDHVLKYEREVLSKFEWFKYFNLPFVYL